MFQRKPRRFRSHSNNRGHKSRSNVIDQRRSRPNSFSNNGQSRNNFRNFQSAEKLLERYNLLAKEAMAVGDKTLSENYLQHADHFTRIIEDKNKNRNQNKVDLVNNLVKEENSFVEDKKNSDNKEIKNKD